MSKIDFTLKSQQSFLKENKVCFVVNSMSLPGMLLSYSLKSYIDLVDGNLMIISGIKDNKNFYGLNAFIEMTGYLIAKKEYDYAVYIDEDCFIDSKRYVNGLYALCKELEEFIDGNYCLAGTQDGGILCHRNHNHLLVNTFLSFWNIKALRDTGMDLESFNFEFNDFIQQNQKFKYMFNYLGQGLTDKLVKNADEKIKWAKQFRAQHFNSDECPYCKVVKNDSTNPVEPHQKPYSYQLDDMEPYYKLETFYLMKTNLPIMYFYASDSYNLNLTDTDTDNSGLTTALYASKDPANPFAYHTWFSRSYGSSKFHKDRINKVLSFLDLL